jgi:hypothetical protein
VRCRLAALAVARLGNALAHRTRHNYSKKPRPVLFDYSFMQTVPQGLLGAPDRNTRPAASSIHKIGLTRSKKWSGVPGHPATPRSLRGYRTWTASRTKKADHPCHWHRRRIFSCSRLPPLSCLFSHHRLSTISPLIASPLDPIMPTLAVLSLSPLPCCRS